MTCPVLESKDDREVRGAAAVWRNVLHRGKKSWVQRPFNTRPTESVAFKLRLHGNALPWV